MAVNSENLKYDGYYWEYHKSFCDKIILEQLNDNENPTDDEILEAFFNEGVKFGEEKAREEMRKHLGDKNPEDSWY